MSPGGSAVEGALSGVPARAAIATGRSGAERPLPRSFYERPVLDVAEDLIGCVLVHRGVAGVIVETEAYHDAEPACHAFAGLTPRTATLFGQPGRAYVYRSYGVHALFNAVCEREGVGAAVLIRALAPLRGLAAMRSRRGVSVERDLCSGPGRLGQALAIELAHNGCSLSEGPITIRRWLAAGEPDAARIVRSPRVGITKAVDLPWRFCLAGCEHVSRPRPFRLGRGQGASGCR